MKSNRSSTEDIAAGEVGNTECGVIGRCPLLEMAL